MKAYRRLITTILCVALVLSMAVMAVAATSQNFFTLSNGYGYTIRGNGYINGRTGTSTLSVSASSTSPSISESELSSHTSVDVYGVDGKYKGSGYGITGTTYSSASYTAKTDVSYIDCFYMHMNVIYGDYTLCS